MAALWQYSRLALYAGGGLVSLATSALYYFQNELIYPRNLPPGARTDVPQPAQFGIHSSESLHLPTPDGETLHAFLIRPDNASRARKVVFMMLHGNAGNVGHRLPIARVLAQELGCSVLMLQYRGYGLSTGAPGEKGIAVDAQTGLDYLRARAELEGHAVVIYGQSIGGAVAVGLAAAQTQGQIAALVLENTFLSIAKLIPSVMPAAKYLVPLCHEKWPSDEYMLKIRDVPILFLSGLKDEIVPPAHMKKLFDLCKAPKVWRELPQGDHNSSVAEPGYFDYIDAFLREYVSR